MILVLLGRTYFNPALITAIEPTHEIGKTRIYVSGIMDDCFIVDIHVSEVVDKLREATTC